MKVHLVSPDRDWVTECGKRSDCCEYVALTIASAAGFPGTICRGCEKRRQARGSN